MASTTSGTPPRPDRIRALGPEDTLPHIPRLRRYARLLTEKEVLTLFSKVRLGIDMCLIKEISADCYPEILIGSRTSWLEILAGTENMSSGELDKLRAETVRRALAAHPGEGRQQA